MRANRGAAGVDGPTLAQFDEDVGNNLYRIWNRMSSGSYMPANVRRVEIPKSDGQVRPLGVPLAPDRIAHPMTLGTDREALCPQPFECAGWSRFWNPCSMTTPTATGLGVQRIKR